MKALSYIFFYTYIGLVVLAGFWGAFLGADFDHQLLFNLNTGTLNEQTRINLLSQYRFLRAMELGFGIFALTFRKEIFTIKKFNRVYLLIMTAGVLARAVSLIDDGPPSWFFYFFLIYEAVGVVVIYSYTKKRIRNNRNIIK